MCISSYGQGLVNFNNSSAPSSKISTNSFFLGPPSGLTAEPVGNYYFSLYYSTIVNTVNGSTNAIVGFDAVAGSGSFVFNDSNWTFGGAYATNSTTPGRISGNSSQVINGLAGGSTARFVVVGWSVGLGVTVAQLQSRIASGNWVGDVLFGQSSVSDPITLGDGGLILSPTILGSGNVSAFTLGKIFIPEPGTMTLMVLGVSSLWFMRRRW